MNRAIQQARTSTSRTASRNQSRQRNRFARNADANRKSLT